LIGHRKINGGLNPTSKEMTKGKAKTIESADNFLDGKSQVAIALFDHFIHQFQKVGTISLHPAKTMIGIATSRKRIAYITQIGKNFIHVVFPFEKPFEDNLCFDKIAQVPGDQKQFNHHFRMYSKDDVNSEVLMFMKLAFEFGS
jgi:hypothetical protein